MVVPLVKGGRGGLAPGQGVQSLAGSETTESRSEAPPARRVRWHPVATHFPIALFGVAFGFQMLHFFFDSECFFNSSNVAIIAGAASMVPALWTGWVDWKRNYKASRARIFKRKMTVGFGMFGVSLAVAIYRNVKYGFHGELPSLHHIWYTFALALLIGGAVAEGFYGGHLIRR
jgi:uncharacterized membrane protein